MIFLQTLMISVYIGLPLWVTWSAYKKPFKGKLFTLANSLLSISLFFALYLLGSWDWVSIYLRLPITFLLIPTIFFEIKKFENIPTSYSKKNYFEILILFLVTLYFSIPAMNTLFNQYPNTEEAITLRFPFKGGTFYIAHGGNTSEINHHRKYGPQGFALDIVKINQYGLRANTLFPKNNSDFEIYGIDVYAPCSGVIKEVVNDQNDISPMDFEQLDKIEEKNIAGNFIFLACDNADILMAHFLEGSLQVINGQKVDTSTIIGKVGNSGNSTEPHLHIHAQMPSPTPSVFDMKIKPLPIYFENKFLLRNDIVELKVLNK